MYGGRKKVGVWVKIYEYETYNGSFWHFSSYPEEFNREGVGIIVVDAMQHTVRSDYTHPELNWVEDNKLASWKIKRQTGIGSLYLYEDVLQTTKTLREEC